MPKDFLAGARDSYDVVVIGSGLAGMTAANILGRAGYQVLLLEQHYKLGGMATWFKRPSMGLSFVRLRTAKPSWKARQRQASQLAWRSGGNLLSSGNVSFGADSGHACR